LDVITKLCLERSIEAIIDASLSPADLHGTNTGVFMGSSISETDMLRLNNDKPAGFAMLGSSRANASKPSFFHSQFDR